MCGNACRRTCHSAAQAVMLICAVLGANAYPDLFVRERAGSCTEHPKRGYGDHGQPVTDKTTSFTLVPADAATAAPSTTLCPGYTYKVLVDYGGVSRATLLTATLGGFKAARDNACPNRSIGMMRSPVYTDQLTVPCTATAGSSLELRVTSAASARDNYHQASATYTINALDKCPSSTCQPTGATGTSKASTSSNTAKNEATAGPGKTETSSSSSSSSPKNVTAAPQAPKATTQQGRPVLGTGILARLFNTTSLAARRTAGNATGSSTAGAQQVVKKASVSTSGAANGTAPLSQAAAAAGTAVTAAMKAAARSPSAPRKAGGDFPILNQLTSTAAQRQQQAAAARTTGNASMPIMARFARATDGAANNLTQKFNTTATDAMRQQIAVGNNTFPALRAALQGLNGSSQAVKAMDSIAAAAGAADSATGQWQGLLQKLETALKGVRH